MGFKASEAVPKLDWDFRPWVDASGTTPEPSGVAQWTFMQNYNHLVDGYRRRGLAQAAKQAEEAGKKSKEERAAEVDLWASYSWDEAVAESARIMEGSMGKNTAEELSGHIAGLIHTVSDGCPNADQIMALPGRIRTAYIGWFVGQVSDPEVLTAGTS